MGRKTQALLLAQSVCIESLENQLRQLQEQLLHSRQQVDSARYALGGRGYCGDCGVIYGIEPYSTDFDITDLGVEWCAFCQFDTWHGEVATTYCENCKARHLRSICPHSSLCQTHRAQQCVECGAADARGAENAD